MADVAALAGVSHQTVSRVLNNPAAVRPQTRVRVLSAIEELGYRRNLSARALVTNRTRLIGVVNPSTMRFGPSHTTMAIQEAARLAGYAIISAGTGDTPGATEGTLDFFLDQAVEGLIVVAPTVATAIAARRLARHLPVVIIATGLQNPSPMHVTGVDHKMGARLATRHLLDLGHEHIAHVAGPSDWFDARARLDGWQKELTEAGLPLAPVILGGWDAVDGYRAGEALLELHPRPTAVVAANDLLSLGIIHYLTEKGMRLPRDMSIVGYDDIPGADYYLPPLTTVRQPFEQVGHEAIRMLLAIISGGEAATSLALPTLVVRSSTAEPGSEHGG